MRPHMGHPAYVRSYHTDETRARMSVSQRRRLGIPDGHVRIYGKHVPTCHAQPLRYWAAWIAWKLGRAEAERFVSEELTAGSPNINHLRSQWLLKVGASQVREAIRAVRDATNHAN